MKHEHELDRMLPLVHEMIIVRCSDEEIIEAFQGYRVAVIANEENLSSHSGQVALVTLVSLIARLGVQVDIRIPEIELCGAQPPLEGCYLRKGLLDLGGDLIPGLSIAAWEGGPTEAAFVLGNSLPPALDCLTWRLSGTAWRGSIQPLEATATAWTESWPIGALCAGGLAAVEVFKAVVRQLQLRQSAPYWKEFVDPCRRASWDFGKGLPTPQYLDMGHLDMVSAGAIAQAFYFVLMRLPHVRHQSRIFENDTTANTNLNRNLLSRYRHIGMHKIDVIRTYDLEKVSDVYERLTKANINDFQLAASVLVGADDIPTRWLVQDHSPKWLGVAGTSHFGALTSSHRPGEPCAGCLHVYDDEAVIPVLPTASVFSFWAGLALAVRLLRKEMGMPYPQDKQALWLVPLRMDYSSTGFWSAVRSRPDCPVQCRASQGVLMHNRG